MVELNDQARDVIVAILGGGQGTRLSPLTDERSKPAVPIGGKYRLIDIPISNAIHSEMRRILVLTQFNSTSLHRHINLTYKFDQFSPSYVQILAAQQTPDNQTWYMGTADAIRQNLRLITDVPGNLVLILLFALLIGRGLVISANAPTMFSRLLAGGVTLTFFTYVFVNMGMVGGLLPVVGVPLPLISYGGTSLVTLLFGIGLLMSIRTNRRLVQT